MLDKVNVWRNKNLLTINCKKSQWMKSNLVSRSQENNIFCLGNIALDKVTEYKYLGLLMDNDLGFSNHRDVVHNRVNYKLSFFKKLRKFINTFAALTIYKSTILPIIGYADFIYDYNIKYNNNRMQSLQNQGLYISYNEHILPFMNKSSTEFLHKEAKLFRLVHGRKLHLLSYASTLTHDSTYLDNRDIRTRNHGAVLFRIDKLNFYKCYQDPVYRAMSEWNNLSVEIRNSVSKSSFLLMIKHQIPHPYTKIL